MHWFLLYSTYTKYIKEEQKEDWHRKVVFFISELFEDVRGRLTHPRHTQMKVIHTEDKAKVVAAAWD